MRLVHYIQIFMASFILCFGPFVFSEFADTTSHATLFKYGFYLGWAGMIISILLIAWWFIREYLLLREAKRTAWGLLKRMFGSFSGHAKSMYSKPVSKQGGLNG